MKFILFMGMSWAGCGLSGQIKTVNSFSFILFLFLFFFSLGPVPLSASSRYITFYYTGNVSNLWSALPAYWLVSLLLLDVLPWYFPWVSASFQINFILPLSQPDVLISAATGNLINRRNWPNCKQNSTSACFCILMCSFGSSWKGLDWCCLMYPGKSCCYGHLDMPTRLDDNSLWELACS